MKQTIAIDVDDVLAPVNEAMMQFINEKYQAGLTLDDYLVPAPYRRYWERVWQVGPEEGGDRYNAFIESGALRHLGVIEGAIEAIRELKKRFRLVIVSAREGRQIEDTHHWLERHFPKVFDDVHFMELWLPDGHTTKAQICKAIGAGYLVDDNVDHCNLATAAGIQALLFGHYGWNQIEKPHDEVVRVRDWAAVLEYFRERS